MMAYFGNGYFQANGVLAERTRSHVMEDLLSFASETSRVVWHHTTALRDSGLIVELSSQEDESYLTFWHRFVSGW